MPTGYTAALYDGEQDFNDFVLRCSRAMMFSVHQREESSDNLPRKREARTDYYEERLRELDEEELSWRNMTEEQKFTKWAEVMNKMINDHAESAATRRARKKRYEEMLDRVRNWNCDVKLESFRKFMIDQLAQSIEYDCREWEPTITPFDEWCQSQEADFTKDRKYWNAKIVEEHGLVKDQHAYIDALYESLGLEYKE